jgi:hypothetical protein
MSRVYALYDITEYHHKVGVSETVTEQTLQVDLEQLWDRATANTLLTTATYPLMPKRYDQRPNFPNQFCEFVHFRQNKDAPNIWTASVYWKTTSNLQERIKDPAERPILITTGTYKYQKSPLKDNDDLPVVTTAGEPISYTYQKAAPTYTFEKNLTNYPTALGKYRDFVNKDTVKFLGLEFKPYELYVPEVSISHLLLENEYRFYSLSFTAYALTEEYGWRTRLRNQGYHELAKVGSKLAYALVNPNVPEGRRVWKQVPIYGFTAIKLGSEGRQVFPTSPVLLTPEGRAFRQLTDQEIAADQAAIRLARQEGRRPPAARQQGYGTGPVMGIQNPNGPVDSIGITQEQFDAAVIEFNFFNTVDFNTVFPLT